ncbi:uncharacterized protein CMU_025050 [Cryptosporidium muris RN66]|uniref:CRAL-TRIO domain-containing protein n=1 Tax=Cryptosporidium muris (strain RN66) TaxID=441375 RepID=B6AAU7_CRYMR|nr:uncharacterized protein CMU_025050 [Cryptosporidium muris RN66]EEA05499.1 hypothetical protein, conserved [Cryptosporidium muris RN66]|eukprot:XP_002139848.1 hypothetical protein [Cryptosporidium muris RN66]
MKINSQLGIYQKVSSRAENRLWQKIKKNLYREFVHSNILETTDLSLQEISNIKLICSEIMKRNGTCYLIIENIKKLLLLRGIKSLRKPEVINQLVYYSNYIEFVEKSINSIIIKYNHEIFSTIRMIEEKQRRVVIRNIYNVLRSGVGLQSRKQPAYYIRVADLQLTRSLKFISKIELRQLIIWQIERVIHQLAQISLKYRSWISHITLAADFSGTNSISNSAEFQLFVDLLSEILEAYSPIFINFVIIHKVNDLGVNIWRVLDKMNKRLHLNSVKTLFTETDSELWNMFSSMNGPILHSRGGFINNTCIYPICNSSSVIEDPRFSYTKEIIENNDNKNMYDLENFEVFFESLKPNLCFSDFSYLCLQLLDISDRDYYNFIND